MTRIRHIALCAALAPLTIAVAAPDATAQVIEETFDDTGFESRGWYDNPTFVRSPVDRDGSTHAAEFVFEAGSDLPQSGTAHRISLPETQSVMISYWVRYSDGWQGSGATVHPHEFYLMTNLDGRFSPPARSHLTVYVEQNAGTPLMILQDAVNIDVSRLREDISGETESRAVAGCNGSSDRYDDGDCYGGGDRWANGKFFASEVQAFSPTPGPYYRGDWQQVRAYVQLNSITDGRANADGVLRYWVDDELLIDVRDAVLRTGQHPDMRFNQLLIGPYMNESPVEQRFWIDDLVIDPTDRPAGETPRDSPSPGVSGPESGCSAYGGTAFASAWWGPFVAAALLGRAASSPADTDAS